jgi:hypothetical protein
MEVGKGRFLRRNCVVQDVVNAERTRPFLFYTSRIGFVVKKLTRNSMARELEKTPSRACPPFKPRAIGAYVIEVTLLSDKEAYIQPSAHFCSSLGLTHLLTQFHTDGIECLYLQCVRKRRIALKIRWPQGRVGSTPSSGTIVSG